MMRTSEPIVRVHQAGQAVVEALLLLPLMVALLWAVSWVGGLQLSAQQMAQLSRKAAMSGALGQSLASYDSREDASLTRRTAALPGVAQPRLAILQHEWFGERLQLLSVHARTRVPGLGAWQALPISRHTHVAIGAGHAHGDADARRRIGNASSAWRQAERDSLAQARRLGPIARRVDGAWGRRALQTDWLSAWADLVPAERLGKRKRLVP